MRSPTVAASPGSSSQSDEAISTLTKEETLTAKRGFLLHLKIPGNDAIDATQCRISDSLCDLCYLFLTTSLSKQNLPDKGRLVWRTCRNYAWLVFKHYTTLRMLKSSANAGCELCSKMLSCPHLKDDDQVVFALSGKSWYTNEFGKEESDWYTFSIAPLRPLRSGMAQEGRAVFEFVLAKDEADCLKIPYDSRQSLQRSPSQCPYSEECLNQIKSWLDNCSRSHPSCCRRDLPMPKRLIDVSPTISTSGTESVMLVESRRLPPSSDKIRYIALSYCWGGWNGLVTKKANLANMRRGISVKDLPAVVSDAIYVCRKSGIQFLWVDLLCICQDDMKEWEVEAANMANVYGGCEFAISALSSSTASEKFCKERDFKPLALGTAKVSYGSWQDYTTLFLRKIPLSLQEEFELSSLNTRGWPLQEKILAPAVLHYGRDQVIWECNTNHLNSETGETVKDSELVIRLSDMRGPEGIFGIRPLWGCILEEYTKRKLTYEKDRFVAISGIASKLREDGTYRGRYVAGLWERDLESQLLWHTTDLSRTTSFQSVQSNPMFPTWSWAYRNLPIDTMLVSEPTSALSVAAKFRFNNKSEKRRSRLGNMVCFCAIALNGFIQRVSEKAIFHDSRPVRSLNGNTRYPGLPGNDSRWVFDQEPLAPGPYYCLRLLETAPNNHFESSHENERDDTDAVIYYLVLRKAKATTISELQDPYVRVGVLMLYEVPPENFTRPYPDVLCKNGKPLLTDGKWMDVALI